MAFTFETSGNNTFLVYEIGQEDRLDTMTLGMITNNRIPGLVAALYTQMNRDRYLKYNVTAKVTAKQFFSGVINRRRLLGVFFGVAEALASAEEYMIDITTLLLDAEYIYVDVSTCKAEVVCLPLIRHTNKCDAVTFFKNIIFTTQFDQTEDCDYVARIISYLNSAPVFVTEDFRKLLEQLQAGTYAHSVSVKQTEPLPAETVQGASPQAVPLPAAQAVSATPPEPGENTSSKPRISFAVPEQGIVQPEADSLADDQVSSEKKMSVFYLLQHYNKENAAAFKAQRAAQKKGAKAAPGGRVESENNGFKFQVPGQQSIPQQAVPPKQVQPQQAVSSKQTQPQQALEPVQPSVQSASQGVKSSASVDDNFGDTVVMSVADGNTVVLGSTMVPAAKPCLHRLSNHDRICIDKPVFHIGKERSYVDYCVSGNATVSRSHADIISRDGQYFIVDNNSTNHTYVDGDRIPSNTEIPLTHGTKIRLSDEEFEFTLF